MCWMFVYGLVCKSIRFNSLTKQLKILLVGFVCTKALQRHKSAIVTQTDLCTHIICAYLLLGRGLVLNVIDTCARHGFADKTSVLTCMKLMKLNSAEGFIVHIVNLTLYFTETCT